MNLAPRVFRPRAAVIQPDIGLPVAQGQAAFPLALVGQGQIVVCIGITRRQLDGPPVSGDRLVGPVQFIQHVAQVKEGQHVAAVGLRGAAGTAPRRGQIGADESRSSRG